MVVPNRELANIIPSDILSTHYHQMDTNCIPEDINMDPPRERSNNLSTISSRESLIYLDESTISYNIRMKIQSKDPAWADQMDDLDNTQLSYANPNIEGLTNSNQAL